MTPNNPPTQMDTQETGESFEDRASDLARQADAALRENPIPAIITAVAIGFGVGLLVRALQPAPHPLRDYFDETSDYVRSSLKPLKKKAKRAYKNSAKVAHDLAEEIRDVDLDPVANWWKRLWS